MPNDFSLIDLILVRILVTNVNRHWLLEKHQTSFVYGEGVPMRYQRKV